MIEIVERKAEEGGWASSFPALGDPVITGEEVARNPIARSFAAGKVESTFPAGEGELLLRWVFRDADDLWYVAGMRFP